MYDYMVVWKDKARAAYLIMAHIRKVGVRERRGPSTAPFLIVGIRGQLWHVVLESLMFLGIIGAVGKSPTVPLQVGRHLS
jgi:hypothetical protein